MKNRQSFIDENTGLFSPPYNDMIDWAGIDLRANAYNPTTNSLKYKNLINFYEIAKKLGDVTFSKEFMELGKKMKKSFNEILWNKEKMAFSDYVTKDFEMSDSYSVQSNILSLMCDITDKTKKKIIIAYIKKGFPDNFKTIGIPFTSFFLHEAMIQNKLYQEATI